jgi:hypothetical protein
VLALANGAGAGACAFPNGPVAGVCPNGAAVGWPNAGAGAGLAANGALARPNDGVALLEPNNLAGAAGVICNAEADNGAADDPNGDGDGV